MLIDCDVHPQLRKGEDLTEYMPAEFRSRYRDRNSYGGSAANYPSPNGGRRLDTFAADGTSGSDPAMWETQLLGEAGVDYAIHLTDVGGGSIDPEVNAAIKGAMNEWTAQTWLSAYNEHGRYRGSITIPLNNAEASVREIEKWAGHPSFVQLLGNPKVDAPLGNRQYDPIWEAAARHGLPLALHSNSAGLPSEQTPVGYCSYYAEVHAVLLSTIYVTHMMSFICEGVFDRFPDFKVIFVEGGFSWVGPVLWRMEKAWSRVRQEFPNVKRSPSEYLYEHMRFTSQPIEEPDRPKDLYRLFDTFDAARILMFSTDYPHWDFDNPKRVLARLSEADRQRIMFQNAAEIYKIPVN